MKMRMEPGAVLRGSQGGRGAPNEKCGPPVTPHFGPASVDFHLNRPVISLIQLNIVAPGPQLELWTPIAPIWLVSEAPLDGTDEYDAAIE